MKQKFQIIHIIIFTFIMLNSFAQDGDYSDIGEYFLEIKAVTLIAKVTCAIEKCQNQMVGMKGYSGQNNSNRKPVDT